MSRHNGRTQEAPALVWAPVTSTDLLAAERDERAAARDRAAELRASYGRHRSSGRRAADEKLAAGDRAAASLDRAASAVDRRRSSLLRAVQYRDQLTGALQRQSGDAQLVRAVDHAHRTGDGLIVAFVDVDHLKSVNDNEGHAAGDALLRAVGTALTSGLRIHDLVIRYGGDEFVCALPQATPADAKSLLERIGAALALALPGASLSTGCVALRPGETAAAVVQRADIAMYTVRRDRRRTPAPADDVERAVASAARLHAGQDRSAAASCRLVQDTARATAAIGRQRDRAGDVRAAIADVRDKTQTSRDALQDARDATADLRERRLDQQEQYAAAGRRAPGVP